MKNNIIIIGLLFYASMVQAQHNAEFVNNGTTVKVQSGAIMTIQGDIHNATNSTLNNDGLIEIQGNLYAENTFQQRGTGTVRLENNDVNVGERQFISGSYAVRGGVTAIGSNDGSFYNLELANTAGIVYLVGGGNVADVRNTVDFLPTAASGTPTRNNIVTHDIGLLGAITYPSNGNSYNSTFGMMNSAPGNANFLNNGVTAGSNLTTIDEGYIIGKLRRAIAPTGGSYGYISGLEPAAINAARGIQYTELLFGNNTYDIIENYFQQGSPNATTVDIECSGYQMNNFWGDRHGEWVFNDINDINGGDYTISVWPQDPSIAFSGTVWTISKDDVFLYQSPDPLHNDCGPTTAGLDRGPFNGFSEFGVLSSTVFVPIELLYLTATPNHNFIQIDWATAKEENTAYFELERSLDGINFEKINTQKAAGTSFNNLYYNHSDYNVLPNVDYYYRIKTIDLDESFDYTYIVVASIKGQLDDNIVNVYPNPVTQDAFFIDIKSIKEQDINIKIYDAIGQLIYTKKMDLLVGREQISIDARNWATGLYLIQLTNKDLNITKEIIKKND